MTIRVSCPSCGRTGRVPDRAIGFNIQCPACSHRHRLTADMVLPEVDDDPPARPRSATTPSGEPTPRTVPADEIYELDEHAVELPKRSLTSTPIVPAHDKPGGFNLPVPVLVGGGIGAALVAILAIWGVVAMFRGPAQDAPVALASDASPEPPATPVPVAPAPAPVQATARVNAADSTPKPPAPPVAAAPAPAPPTADPAEVSVVEAMQTTDEIPPEPAEDPAIAARARAGAATVNTRDDGAGKTLSTAEIVAESEPSVALIKGKVSSGTGFLVAPGLLATNSHVIADEFIPDLEVRFVSADERHNTPLKAQLLYEDPVRDLALLAVRTDLKPLRVARTYTFRKGEDITVIGNPGMGDGQVLENAISRGVMSTKAQLDNRDFYQLGIAVNPGNSGGPVFDSSGRVIGVVTLKATKQEATSFSIPIEDLHKALDTLARGSPGDADRDRSRHRIKTAVMNLGGGGALMCFMIDLRRPDIQANNASARDALARIEPITAEFDKEMASSLTVQAARIEHDPLVAPSIKRKVGDLRANFERIRGAYAGNPVDPNQLRPVKQAYKRLLIELATALKLEVPPNLMIAFDDHTPAQPTIITTGPGIGLYGSRLRQRALSRSRGLAHPPSLHDRMRRGRLR